MAISEQLSKTGPYIDRLFEDDYVREQIGEALVRGRRALRRARAQRAAQAVQDKTLMGHVTGALGSLQEAVRALTGRPQPKPAPPRRWRTVLLFAMAMAAAGAAAYVDNRERRRDDAPATG